MLKLIEPPDWTNPPEIPEYSLLYQCTNCGCDVDEGDQQDHLENKYIREILTENQIKEVELCEHCHEEQLRKEDEE